MLVNLILPLQTGQGTEVDTLITSLLPQQTQKASPELWEDNGSRGQLSVPCQVGVMQNISKTRMIALSTLTGKKTGTGSAGITDTIISKGQYQTEWI